MAVNTKDLGAVSAYAIAVENGYTGTELQWATEIANASNNAQAAAASAAAAQSAATSTVAAVEAKGQEVIASIPLDYTTLNNEVSGLKSAVSGATDSYNASLAAVDTALQGYGWAADITSSLQWVSGKMLTVGGSVADYSALSYAVIGFVRKGDKYRFATLRGMGTSRAIMLMSTAGIVDNRFTPISYTPTDAGYFTGEYTVPENGILAISTSSTGSAKAYKYAPQYSQAAPQAGLDAVNGYVGYVSPDVNLIDFNTLTDGPLSAQGAITSMSTTYVEKTSAPIKVDVTHTYKFVCDVPTAIGTSWLAVGMWDANGDWLARQPATVTTVDDVSHAEVTICPIDTTAFKTADTMRVSWRTYVTKTATAADITFAGKDIFDALSGKAKTYKVDGKIDVKKSGFDIVQLGFAPQEATGKLAQGIAVANGTIFQGYGDGSIDLIDLTAGTLINSYAASAGHAGSLSFSSVYPDGNAVYPYLYVASYNENKTFAYNVTQSACTLVKTYLIPTTTAGYYQETCIDKVTNILWCVGHKANSYGSGEGLVVSAWDLANVTEENGLYTPAEIMHYDLPWVPYLQTVQALNGQLFVMFGADGTDAGMLTHILVIDLGHNAPKAEIKDFPEAVLNAEPEGIDFVFNTDTWQYDAILATRRSLHYYRLAF